jgi:hypothetical protein
MKAVKHFSFLLENGTLMKPIYLAKNTDYNGFPPLGLKKISKFAVKRDTDETDFVLCFKINGGRIPFSILGFSLKNTKKQPEPKPKNLIFGALVALFSTKRFKKSRFATKNT